jgi:hypothetical protein
MVREHEINTKAEPISLAIPESGCNSSLILSTIASSAELISSHRITKTKQIISIDCSNPVFPSQKATGVRTKNSHTSRRKASSLCHVAYSPCFEKIAALASLLSPLALGLLARCCCCGGMIIDGFSLGRIISVDLNPPIILAEYVFH